MKRTALVALIAFALGLFLAGLIFVYFPEKNTSDNFPQVPSPSMSSTLYASYASDSMQAIPETGFARIVEKVGPAVVWIEAEKVEKRTISSFSDEWPFEDFWDRFFGTPREREKEFRSKAYGTGFFISQDGYILTNNHIVENSEKVTVFTRVQDKEYEAEIVGTDPKTDIALLKVNDKNLVFADLGDSTKLRVGEWVVAIGNPLGMEHTVTAGIVSAKGRQIQGSLNVPEYQDFIQTDAAINRGNSGGPLVNMNGEVIGITSMILAPTGGNIGIGFAIPSNLAKKIVMQLKEKGRVVRGFLGVIVSSIDEDTKKVLNLKSKKGAFVNSVGQGTPAEKSGLKRYDVIIAINDEPIEGPNELKFKIAEIEPGTTIKITIIRDEEEKTLKAKVIELEEEEPKETPSSTGKDVGFSVTTLTPNIARRYRLQTTEGLLITEVRRYSEADKKGLQRGDIIIEANRKNIKTIKDLENVLKKAKSGDPIMLLIRRETGRGEPQDFIVTIRVP